MSTQPKLQSKTTNTAATSGFRLWRLLNTMTLVVAFFGSWALLNSCGSGYPEVPGWRVTLMVAMMGWLVAAENLVHFLVVLMIGIGGIALGHYAINNLVEAWVPRGLSHKWSLNVPLAVSGLGLLSFWVYSFWGEAGFQVIHFEWGYRMAWLGFISAIILESAELLYRLKHAREHL